MTSLVTTLAKKSAKFGVKASYGDPVDLGGVTIVPVSLVYAGFGGGQGGPDDPAEGGGGGGLSVPVGAYVKQGDTAVFRPNLISLLAVSIPVLWVTGKAVKAIVKAAKR